MTSVNTIAHESTDQIKTYTKYLDDNINKMTHDTKSVFLKDTNNESSDSLKTFLHTVLIALKRFFVTVQETMYPYLADLHHKYINRLVKHVNTGNSNSTNKTNISSLNINFSSSNEFLRYIPLVFELYFILFHIFIVRMWILMNFICTVLYMYDNLTEFDIIHRTIPIGINEIKKLASFVIGSGIVIMLFFTQSDGFFTLPVMIYLINRTSKNIFNKGF